MDDDLNFKKVIEFISNGEANSAEKHKGKILQMAIKGHPSLKVVFFTAEICCTKILPIGLIKIGKHNKRSLRVVNL